MSGPLRCRPGDLAVIVRSPGAPALIGRIVRIVAPCPVHARCWDTDPPVFVPWDTSMPASAPDEVLRPLRDGDGDDEVLRLVGLPVERETIA